MTFVRGWRERLGESAPLVKPVQPESGGLVPAPAADLERFESMLAAGNFAGARALSGDLIRQYPGDPGAQSALAMMLLADDDVAGAARRIALSSLPQEA